MIHGISIPAHPRNQHPGSTESATRDVSSCSAQGRKLRTNWAKKKAFRKRGRNILRKGEVLGTVREDSALPGEGRGNM